MVIGRRINRAVHGAGSQRVLCQLAKPAAEMPLAREDVAFRKYRAPPYVGLPNFRQWLDYKSPALNGLMLDWVCYINTLSLPVTDLASLYQHYAKNGAARGIWQIEVDDEYLKSAHDSPRYFVDFALWEVTRNCGYPDKCVSMVYHWNGHQPFRPTHHVPPQRAFDLSGQRLIVQRRTACASLAAFSKESLPGPTASCSALLSVNHIATQMKTESGQRPVAVPVRCSHANRTVHAQASGSFYLRGMSPVSGPSDSDGAEPFG